MHRGNANFGHYTSLINVTQDLEEEPKWMEFDDSKIYPFNMKNFEDECFGMRIRQDYPSNFMGVESNISKSAYILVYEKVKKSSLKLKFTEENIQELEKVKSALKDKEKFSFKENILETNFYNLGQFIPENLKNFIERDNVNLVLESQLFSGHFTNFFTEILNNSDLPLLSIDMPAPTLKLNSYQSYFCDLILKICP